MPHTPSAQVRFNQASVCYYSRPRWLGGKPTYALKPLDLIVERQNLAIVGPSGAGKSTIIELLFGLRRPTSGEIYICDMPLSAISNKQRQRLCQHIQLIPQEPQSSLNPYYSVQQILQEPLLLHRGSDNRWQDKIQRALNDVGLDHSILARTPDRLSVGQAQRVAIARALILEPCVLVADEPTSSLDPISRQQILDLFAHIQQSRQMRLILISHDLQAALQLCDKIMVLDQGQVVEYGPARQIMIQPQHATTQALLRAQN